MTEVIMLGVPIRQYLVLKEKQGFPAAKEFMQSRGLDALYWEATVIDWVVSNGNWQYEITEKDLERMGWFNDHGGFGDEAMIIALRPTDKYELKPDSVRITE